MTEILAIGKRSNNAQLIVDCVELGYIVGSVLDLTYGEGNFWTKHRPEDLVTNDLFKEADFNEDWRSRTQWQSESFTTVVFDPPYKLAGARDNGGSSGGGLTMDDRYGTEQYSPVSSVRQDLISGTQEACRLSSQFVIVKCMDQVAGGKVNWQTDDVTLAATECQFRKVDLLMLKRGRAQDPERRQLHARRNYSTLLVFERLLRSQGPRLFDEVPA